jgi:hypothetical protein
VRAVLQRVERAATSRALPTAADYEWLPSR